MLQYYIYILFFIANKNQQISNLHYQILKISYNNYNKSINTIIKFNFKKLFFYLLNKFKIIILANIYITRSSFGLNFLIKRF